MTNSSARRSHASAIASIILAATSMVLVACANESDANPPQAPIDGTGVSLSPICRDVAATRKSMEDAVTSVMRLDEAALDEASSEAHADLDNLAGVGSRIGSRAHRLRNCPPASWSFERLLAQPQLSWSDARVRTQIRQISDDLAAIENTAGCPA